MLLIKTHLAPSNIEGVGLFARQNIKKGTVTWKYTPEFDSSFETKRIKEMPKLLQDFILNYSSLSMVTDKYILGNDNVRFTNHSSKPNLESVNVKGEIEKVARAKRDIKKGEELTIDYRTFDKSDASSDKEYLTK